MVMPAPFLLVSAEHQMEATETQIDVASSLSKPSVVERTDGLGEGGEDRVIKISGSMNPGDPPTCY